MRLLQFAIADRRMLGLATDAGITSLTERLPDFPDDMIDLIRHWNVLERTVRDMPDTADYRLSDVRILPPVSRPGKVLGIGLNYADHIAESGVASPEHQVWFTKAVTSITGPFDPIERPAVSAALDYEAELVFVVGARCKHVDVADAAAAIFGYTVGNDVSVRDWQHRTGQYMIGKSFDTHAPIGPWLVTPDEIEPRDLAIRSFVNGEPRQESNTRHLIFDCAAQLAHLSQAMTMEPGDLIFTGTPGGVGAAMKPPKWLRPGDRVRVEIDGIGAIENDVVDEALSDGASSL